MSSLNRTDKVVLSIARVFLAIVAITIVFSTLMMLMLHLQPRRDGGHPRCGSGVHAAELSAGDVSIRSCSTCARVAAAAVLAGTVGEETVAA